METGSWYLCIEYNATFFPLYILPVLLVNLGSIMMSYKKTAKAKEKIYVIFVCLFLLTLLMSIYQAPYLFLTIGKINTNAIIVVFILCPA